MNQTFLEFIWSNNNEKKEQKKIIQHQFEKERHICKYPDCSLYSRFPEAVVQRCSVKEVFLEISQKLLGNTCGRVSFLVKLQV